MGKLTNAHEFGDEQGKTDTDGGNECSLVLLGSKHEDGEDELRGQEHLALCQYISSH